MNPRSLLALAVLLACAAVAPAAAAAPIAAPATATAVREYQGIVVFTQYDADEQVYRLAIRRPGAAAPEVLPVAPADRPFNADIGPDSSGEPQLIYERCPETCELFVLSLTRGTGERAVRNANDPDHPDVAPTLWKGRIAWARIYGERADRKVVVYTKLLTAPRSRPSTRLPGVPQRRCPDGGRCAATQGRSVDALELWGDNLAQVVGYVCGGCGGIAQTEVRLVRVSDRNARPVAFTTVGLSGQSFVGPSFFSGRLAWYETCLGDPGGCPGGGTPWRHRISTGAYEEGARGPVRVTGFADLGSRHLRTDSCSSEPGPEFNGTCRIEELDAPAYEDARAPTR